MNQLQHHRPAASRQSGFTLLEVLLAVVMLLVLIGASVFGYRSLGRNAHLDEGSTRMETLLRFARAHAAQTGRQVKVVFPAASQEEKAEPKSNVQVKWEPDPLGHPGEFHPLPQSVAETESLNDLVSVVRVELAKLEMPEIVMPATEESAEQPMEEPVAVMPTQTEITFMPDGTSDSAEITMTSRDEEDTRTVAVRLSGLTGATEKNWRPGALPAAKAPVSE